MGRGKFLTVICTVIVMVTSLTGLSTAGDTVDCDIQNRACTKTLQSATVTFDIQPKPVKAMKDLQFRVTLSGIDPVGVPTIDLGMPGMKMGPNRVRLKSMGDGVYAGTGVIVRCPSGRRIWYARVAVPKLGQVDFTFDVIY